MEAFASEKPTTPDSSSPWNTSLLVCAYQHTCGEHHEHTGFEVYERVSGGLYVHASLCVCKCVCLQHT